MKKILYRILAYVLDLGLVSVIILGLSMLSFVNPNNDKLNYKYKEYYTATTAYDELSEKLGDYFEDGRIDTKEITEIHVKYADYSDAFKSIKVNEGIKNKDIETIKDRVNELSIEVANNHAYEINKLNSTQVIISLIVYVLYFGVLQYFLNGQTVFKRLLKLKVVNNKDSKKKVPLWNYIVRALLVTEIIISLVDLILLFTLNQSIYITSNYWITQIKYIYEMAFLVCMIVRDDARSVDDLILNTRVLRYDKSGREIKEKLFDDKEIVKAEKIND